MNANQPFFSSLQALQYLQERFGSTDYQNWQSIRSQFWSYVDYGTTGAATFTFFGTALGGSGQTKQQTNIPKAGSFGQNHFLLKSIGFNFFVDDPELDSWDGTDAEMLYSDFINGFIQAGVGILNIQSREFIKIPKPFLYAPGVMGAPKVHSAGIEALTLSEATPNTLDTYRTAHPHADLNSREDGMYKVSPNILIEAEQNFSVNVNFPSGALAPIATGIIDGTNTAWIGCVMDGILFRPVQ